MIYLRDVQAGSVRLAYRVTGRPDAPPMVLLHGLGDHGAIWDEVAAAFARAWRVFAPDFRGHGRSDWPGSYSFELMRDDVLAFLDALGLDRVTLVGHSAGGVVSYLVAQDHPRLVDRLVIEDVPPPRPRVRAVPERPDGPLPFDWQALLSIHQQLAAPDPAWWEKAAEIAAETLIVAGGPDSQIPQEQLTETAQRIPEARLVTIPAGHYVHTRQPAEFLAEVNRFLGSS